MVPWHVWQQGSCLVCPPPPPSSPPQRGPTLPEAHFHIDAGGSANVLCLQRTLPDFWALNHTQCLLTTVPKNALQGPRGGKWRACPCRAPTTETPPCH